MKIKYFSSILMTTALFTNLAHASQTTLSQALNIKPGVINTTPPAAPAKNVIVVDNRGYIIPDSIKLIRSANGQFKVDRIDIIGHKVGNGGDYIRSTFIQVGKKALEYVLTTEAGNTIVRKNNLNTDDLKAALDINRVVLTDETLFDDTGSVVDAIGIPGLIILNSSAWLEHFEKERNIQYLVFHELLRSASVNDDNYVISTDLIQIPNSFRLATRLVPLIPMIEGDSIQSLFDLSSVASNGSGCSAQKKEIYTELDLTKNSLEISLSNYITQNDTNRLVDNKACSLAIPVKLPKGKRLVISLIDLQGVVSPRIGQLQTTSSIKFEAFIAGTIKPSNAKVITLGSDERSFLFRKTDVLTSGCGTTEMIRLNTSNTLTSKVISQTTTGSESILANTSQIKKISVLMNIESCP